MKRRNFLKGIFGTASVFMIGDTFAVGPSEELKSSFDKKPTKLESYQAPYPLCKVDGGKIEVQEHMEINVCDITGIKNIIIPKSGSYSVLTNTRLYRNGDPLKELNDHVDRCAKANNGYYCGRIIHFEDGDVIVMELGYSYFSARLI